MLIELIMVTAMIGTTVLAILLSFIYGQTASGHAKHHNRASQIASQEIEIVRNTDYDSLTVPYNGDFIGNPDAVTELPGGVGNLVISYFDTPNDTVKQVVATVTWTEHDNTQSVEYTTLVVDNGL